MDYSKKPLLTVFTPTYNRAYSLTRTYESMKAQNSSDFIWLIVDDGSTDDTADMIRGWQDEDNLFEIRYIYKENGGMHTAHNVAYQNIDTELNVCIDSDDALAVGAVEKILSFWKVHRNEHLAGIVGLDCDMQGNLIGTDFGERNETTLSGFYRTGGRGDKKLVLRTDIVRKYPPYPEFPGERFVPLDVLYVMIDQDHTLAVINEPLCNVEYMPDGSTRNILKQYVRNPRGFAYSRKVSLNYETSFKRRCMLCTHYVSHSIFAHNKKWFSESPAKFFTVLALVPGILLTLYIKYKTKEKVKNDT